MSKTPIPQFSQEAILQEFHALAALGEEILIPLSVTEDTLKRRTSRKENEITSYLHRFDFGDFFLSLIYTPQRSDLTSAPSTLEMRICLDKTETLFFFMPYDIIPYINPKDMICRYFPYIESPERLRSCYRDLAESIVPYLDDFARLSADESTRQRAYRDLKNEMARCYGENVDAPSGKGEDYDAALMAVRFAHFVKWKSSFYASPEYGAYLKGDYTALSAIAFRGARPDYIKHLALSALGTVPGSYQPVRESSASLPAMLDAQKPTKTFGVLALTLLFTLPLVAVVLSLLYFGVATMVAKDCLYYTALSSMGYSGIIYSILLASAVLALSARPVILAVFFKDRYAASLPYRQMAKAEKRQSLLPRTRHILAFLAVLFTVFSACQGIRFSDNAITVQTSFIPSDPAIYDYSDIETVVRHTRNDGSFYYVITFDDGEKYTLKEYMDADTCEEIEASLAPAFQKHGVSVTDHETDSPEDSGHHDNTNQA